MITNNFEILNNINPCSFNFNQSRHHQNQDPSSSNPQPSNSDPNNNDPNNQTASTSSSSKSFHHHLRPSTTGHEKEIGGGETSNSANKKENDDIDYSLIVRIRFIRIRSFECLISFMNSSRVYKHVRVRKMKSSYHVLFFSTGFRYRYTLFTYR